MFKMPSLALGTSTNMGAPLLHCSINDMLISRIPRCLNVFTKLISILDLTFVQVYDPLLQKLISIPCAKNYHYYYHFGYMQITFASFLRYSGY